MTKTIDALVEALERVVSTGLDQYTHDQVMSRPDHYINAALAQARAEQAEPVKNKCQKCDGTGEDRICCGNWATGAEYFGQSEQLCCGNPDLDSCSECNGTGVLIPPAAPVAKLEPLTEPEIWNWLNETAMGAQAKAGYPAPNVLVELARAIEAAHNAKLGGCAMTQESIGSIQIEVQELGGGCVVIAVSLNRPDGTCIEAFEPRALRKLDTMNLMLNKDAKLAKLGGAT